MTQSRSNQGRAAGTRASILALLLIICLVESATEQRINSEGSKSNLIEKITGWRSQRGGSCKSYGHSCWGAHGKRSVRPPMPAPDWYVTRMLRSMSPNPELVHTRQMPARNDDLNTVFQVLSDDEPAAAADKQLISQNEEYPVGARQRNMEAKPMLDDELLSQIKIWQIMRQMAEEQN